MKKMLFTITAIIISALVLYSCENAPILPPEPLPQESSTAAPSTPATPTAPAAPSTDDSLSEPDSSPEQTAKAEYIKLTPQQAQEMMETNDVIILDVRTQTEFDTGHLPDAILLPDYEVSEKAEAVIPDKSSIIIVYCRSGRRSETASRTLIRMGYAQVYDIGGIQSWTGEILRAHGE